MRKSNDKLRTLADKSLEYDERYMNYTDQQNALKRGTIESSVRQRNQYNPMTIKIQKPSKDEITFGRIPDSKKLDFNNGDAVTGNP